MHPGRGRHHKHAWKKHHMQKRMGYPPVNIEEEDDRFVLEFFAAGYRKEDFMITLADDMLTVSAKVENGDTAHDHPGHHHHGRHRGGRRMGWHQRMHSFKPGSFERDFILSEKIDTEQLEATYTDGLLRITLPKKAGMETTRSEIQVD